MKDNAALLEKLSYHEDLNECYLRTFGRDERGELAIISEDLEKTYSIFKEEVDNKQVKIYPFDQYVKCDNCYTIVYIDNSSIDTESGEVLCLSCLENF